MLLHFENEGDSKARAVEIETKFCTFWPPL